MSASQSNKQQKQNYLRSEILEQGYDPQHFIRFISSNSAQGIDLEEWDMEQLKGIVAKYKLVQQMERSKLNQSQFQPQKQPQSKDIDSSNNDHGSFGGAVDQKYMHKIQQKKSRIQYENYKPIFDYEFQGVCKCIKNSQLAHVKELKIQIPQYELKQIEGSFFGFGAKTQVWFNIKSNLMAGRVKRIAQDFQWLAQSLVRLYPTMVLPELEVAKLDGKTAYQVRRVELEQYMQQISYRKELHRSQLLIDFLTLSNQKIHKYRKNYDSMGFARGVALVKNEEGQVEMDLSNNLRQFVKSAYSHNRKISTIHQTIHLNVAKLMKDLDVVKEDLYTVVDNFAQLHDCYAQHTNMFPPSRNDSYNEMLVNLNNLFLGMGDYIKSNIRTVEESIKNYFLLNSSYDRSLNKLSRVVKQAEKEYLEYKYQLFKKKERLYTEPERWDINQKHSQHVKVLLKQLAQIQNSNQTQAAFLKNEINEHILPKQSLVQKELKMWYAYLLKNYEYEFTVWIQLMADRYASKYKRFAASMLNNDKLYLQTLSKFISQTLKYSK